MSTPSQAPQSCFHSRACTSLTKRTCAEVPTPFHIIRIGKETHALKCAHCPKRQARAFTCMRAHFPGEKQHARCAIRNIPSYASCVVRNMPGGACHACPFCEHYHVLLNPCVPHAHESARILLPSKHACDVSVLFTLTHRRA